jgi:hypothetical protein
MLVRQAQQPITGMMMSVMTLRPALDWQDAARSAFRETERDAVAAMRASLASRVLALTGSRLSAALIYVDSDAREATAALDNVIFRLRNGNLMLVRPCSVCGQGQFESMPLEELSDLGHALDVWEPTCAHCPLGDEDDATSIL